MNKRKNVEESTPAGSTPADSTPAETSPAEQLSTEGGALSFREMLQSTLAAAIGVQNAANRKRDFTRGNWLHFVYMGVGFTAFFVLLMSTIVRVVLST